MPDNKKYYYIKLKDNYFDQDNIKVLEAQENGYIYSLIIIKLSIKSARYGGCLMMTDKIPYSPDKIETLAKIINHDVSHVRDAIRIASELDLITIVDGYQIWITQIQNMIGHSSTEADRMRKYRKQLDNGKEQKKKKSVTNVITNVITNEQQMLECNKCTPELEKERDIKLEREIKINSRTHAREEKNNFKDPLIDYLSTSNPSFQEYQPAEHKASEQFDIDGLMKLWNDSGLPNCGLPFNLPNLGPVKDAIQGYGHDYIRETIINLSENKEKIGSKYIPSFYSLLANGKMGIWHDWKENKSNTPDQYNMEQDIGFGTTEVINND